MRRKQDRLTINTIYIYKTLQSGCEIAAELTVAMDISPSVQKPFSRREEDEEENGYLS